MTLPPLMGLDPESCKRDIKKRKRRVAVLRQMLADERKKQSMAWAKSEAKIATLRQKLEASENDR